MLCKTQYTSLSLSLMRNEKFFFFFFSPLDGLGASLGGSSRSCCQSFGLFLKARALLFFFLELGIGLDGSFFIMMEKGGGLRKQKRGVDVGMIRKMQVSRRKHYGSHVIGKSLCI